MPSRFGKSAAEPPKKELSIEEQVIAKRKQIQELGAELGAEALIGSDAAMKLSSSSNKPSTSPSSALLPTSTPTLSSSRTYHEKQEALIANMLYPSQSTVLAREEDRIRRIKRYNQERAEKEIKEMQEKMRMQYELRNKEIELNYKMRTLELMQQEMAQSQEMFRREVERWKSQGGGSRAGHPHGAVFGSDPISRGEMLILTTQGAPGYKVISTLGTVTGSHVTKIGDEELSEEDAQRLPGEARRQALGRLQEDARALGANCVVSFAWHTRVIGEDVSELLCIGTALRVESEKPQTVHCGACGHTHTQGGKGGNNQNQGGGKGGKNKKKRPPDCEHAEDEECDCPPVENQNNNNNKEGGGGKKGGKGGGGPQLTPMESLVKMLMEMKLKEERDNHVKSQRDALAGVLDQFFAAQENKKKTLGAGFEWLDKLMAERDAEKAKSGGGNQNNNAGGWSTSGQGNDQSGKKNNKGNQGGGANNKNQRAASPPPAEPSGWGEPSRAAQQTDGSGWA